MFPCGSLVHLMCAIGCAHASTCTTSLMHVGHWNEENERTKTLN